MSLNLQPHTFRKAKGGGQVLTRTVPYIRLRVGEEPPIFIQGGKFFYEGGSALAEKDIPKWVAGELKKISEQAKREVGLGGDSED